MHGSIKTIFVIFSLTLAGLLISTAAEAKVNTPEQIEYAMDVSFYAECTEGGWEIHSREITLFNSDTSLNEWILGEYTIQESAVVSTIVPTATPELSVGDVFLMSGTFIVATLDDAYSDDTRTNWELVNYDSIEVFGYPTNESKVIVLQ